MNSCCPPPFNHNSNFAGLWSVRAGVYTYNKETNSFSGPVYTSADVEITATSDPRFYQIKILTGDRQGVNRPGVVGMNYDLCGRVIGYYLLNNGPFVNDKISQQVRILVPNCWTPCGTPTQLEGVSESSIDETGDYNVVYTTWIRI